VLGGSHFFVRTIGSSFGGRFWESPQFNFPFWGLPRFSELKKFQLSAFQGQWFSHNFELLIFRDDSYKSILTNHDFLLYILHIFKVYLCFFFLIISFFFVRNFTLLQNLKITCNKLKELKFSFQ
jgi:hypothetical protein